MEKTPFGQTDYDIRFEWGSKGARDAAERGDIVIIVDVLSFSSAVVAALDQGAIVYPHAPNEKAKAFTESVGAKLAVKRSQASKDVPSLSPVSWNVNHRGKKYVLPSPNGAVCTTCASKAAKVLVGGLVNAAAVASAAQQLREKLGKPITVIAAGERWQDAKEHENDLRPSLEDYLGAGAIIAHLEGNFSPEAEVCRSSLNASKNNLQQLIWNSGSGRELREIGYEEDVKFSSQLDSHKLVPVMQGQKVEVYEESN